MLSFSGLRALKELLSHGAMAILLPESDCQLRTMRQRKRLVANAGVFLSLCPGQLDRTPSFRLPVSRTMAKLLKAHSGVL